MLDQVLRKVDVFKKDRYLTEGFRKQTWFKSIEAYPNFSFLNVYRTITFQTGSFIAF